MTMFALPNHDHKWVDRIDSTGLLRRACVICGAEVYRIYQNLRCTSAATSSKDARELTVILIPEKSDE